MTDVSQLLMNKIFDALDAPKPPETFYEYSIYCFQCGGVEVGMSRSPNHPAEVHGICRTCRQPERQF